MVEMLEDQHLESALVDAVQNRPHHQSVLQALRDHLIRTRTHLHANDPVFTLIEATPALRDYAHRMWLRHEKTLSGAISEATGLPADSVAVTGLARFTLDIPAVARGYTAPATAIVELFDLLSRGWSTTGMDIPDGKPKPPH
ncbi:TetR family transcriptional regulator [Streptomyces sp. NPDC002680]|uniref:TetR family transcriptional regulator n=1 Tax=Streptomyces sp. NPDC002680 TaxID=3364659 RepID=UPI00369B43B1